MVQRKKSGKYDSIKKKTPAASTGKNKLGNTSLDWIIGATEGEETLSEQADNSNYEPAGKSIEKKIGVLKQYIPEGAGKKKEITSEIIPAISGFSSTIIKGKRVTPSKEEETRKTELKEEDKGKTISAKWIPVEIGKTCTVTEEKKIVPAVKEEKTVSIPEDSSSIVKKKKETTFQKKIISENEKTPPDKKKIAAAVAEDELLPAAKKNRMKISGLGEALKKGSIKVSGAVIKPFKSDKTKVTKSVSAVINVSRQPVKAISAVDRKITQSMKKVVLSGVPVIAGKSLFKKIRSADARITKSIKKLMGSIID